MTLSLISEPIYATDDRDVNPIYNLLINSFQGIVCNWYIEISLNNKNRIEIDVKRKLREFRRSLNCRKILNWIIRRL